MFDLQKPLSDTSDPSPHLNGSHPLGADPVALLLEQLYFPRLKADVVELEAGSQREVSSGVVCMYVVVQGEASLELGDEAPITAKAGDHLVVTRGVAHRIFNPHHEREDPLSLVAAGLRYDLASPAVNNVPTKIVCCRFDLSCVRRNPLDIGLPEVVHLNRHRDSNLASCQPLLQLILSIESSKERDWEIMLRRLVELLLVKTLAAELRRETNARTPNETHRMLGAITDPVVGPVLSSIVETIHEPWSVSRMARMANKSKSTFSMRFRSLVNQTPLQFLTDLRMQKACRLLRETDVGISNVARLVGYDSPSSFSNAFRRCHGTSPADYRRSDRAGEDRSPATPQD